MVVSLGGQASLHCEGLQHGQHPPRANELQVLVARGGSPASKDRPALGAGVSCDPTVRNGSTLDPERVSLLPSLSTATPKQHCIDACFLSPPPGLESMRPSGGVPQPYANQIVSLPEVNVPAVPDALVGVPPRTAALTTFPPPTAPAVLMPPHLDESTSGRSSSAAASGLFGAATVAASFVTLLERTSDLTSPADDKNRGSFNWRPGHAHWIGRGALTHPSARPQFSNPCLLHGKTLLNELAGLPLQPALCERLTELLEAMGAAVSACYDRGIRPTVLAIQEKLRAWSFSRLVEESTLRICARDPSRFMLWVPVDGPICVLLADRPLEEAHVSIFGDSGDSSSELLDALIQRDRVAGRPGKRSRRRRQNKHVTEDGGTWPIPKNPPKVSNDGGQKAAPAVTTVGNTSLFRPRALASAMLLEGVTTVMVRNLPLDTNRRHFLEELSVSGFGEQLDFLHMPCQFDTGVIKGYAFLNFVSVEAAAAFVKEWHGSRRFVSMCQGRPLAISKADVQGRTLNEKMCDSRRMQRVRNPALRPVLA